MDKRRKYIQTQLFPVTLKVNVPQNKVPTSEELKKLMGFKPEPEGEEPESK